MSKNSVVEIEGRKISALLKAMKSKPPRTIQGAVDAGRIMENPRRIPVSQGDCVSCHVATTTLNYAYEKLPGAAYEASMAFTFKAKKGEITYAMDPLIKERVAGPTYQVFSLAYLNGEPSVSTRTLNETVEVVQMCNAKFYPLLPDQGPASQQGPAIKPPAPPPGDF